MKHVDDLTALGRRIRQLREARGLTQRELMFDGCSYAYLSRVEQGGRQPSVQVLEELARRLGTTVHYLKTGEDDPRELALALAARLTSHAIRGPGSRNGEYLRMLDDLDEALARAGIRHEEEEPPC